MSDHNSGIPGLERKPFITNGRDSYFIETPSAASALALLREVYRDPRGLGIFTGLRGSGRRTVLEQFASRLQREDISAVVVDGNGMDRETLLRTVLSSIGYELESVAADDLSGMLRVFLVHQCHAGQPAFLAFRSLGGMHPSALEEVCRLAQISADGEAAARIVIAGDERLERIVGAPAMSPVRERATLRFELRPLDLSETTEYLQQHLQAAGAESLDRYLSADAVAQIWQATSGLPGEIDAMALRALRGLEHPVQAQAIRELLGIEAPAGSSETGSGEEAPESRVPHTRLVVSLAGKIVDDRLWPTGRVLIGRGSHNDISLLSRYISRHHALLVMDQNGAWLSDLRSVNGTYVNSRRVEQTPLYNDDVISIGNHRVKYINPAARQGEGQPGAGLAETMVMASLQQERHLFPVQTPDNETVTAPSPTGTDDKNSD